MSCGEEWAVEFENLLEFVQIVREMCEPRSRLGCPIPDCQAEHAQESQRGRLEMNGSGARWANMSMGSGEAWNDEESSEGVPVIEDRARAIIDEYNRATGPDELSVRRVWRRLVLSLRDQVGCDSCDHGRVVGSCSGSDICGRRATTIDNSLKRA